MNKKTNSKTKQTQETKDNNVLLWNLKTTVKNLEAITREFENNHQYAKERQNGVTVYHEIISFNNADRAKVSPDMLNDIAQRYLESRALNSLAYAEPHFDTENPHIHLVISGNQIKSAKSIRISKFEFQDIKIELEKYQRERYPELENSQVEHKATNHEGEKSPKQTRREQELTRRLKKTNSQIKNQTKKESLTELILKHLKFSPSEAQFRTQIKNEGLTTYQRGNTAGIEDLASSERYRFKTLGIQNEYEEAKERWKRIIERNTELETLQIEKEKQQWQELGFTEDIQQMILENGETTAKQKEINDLLKQKRQSYRQAEQSFDLRLNLRGRDRAI